MKRIASIALLVLLLYNMMGYFFVYVAQSYSEREELYNGLSMSLPNETLINFQIPLTYYPQPNREPENVKGEFVYEGKYYDMNRQWVHGDTLYIEAFENAKQKMLEQSLYEHVQDNVIDHQNKALPGKTPLEKSKRMLANLLKDYLPQNQLAAVPYVSVEWVAKGTLISKIAHLSTRFLEIKSPPPQFIG